MPILSAFTPCGALTLSGAPSYGQLLYDELNKLYGAPSGTLAFAAGTYDEAKLYAYAMGLARALYELDHAGNQSYPQRAYDLLPLLELDFIQTPGPLDGVPARQAAVAAAALLPNGAVAANVVNGLRTILGSAFLAYVPTDPNGINGPSPNIQPDPLNPTSAGAHFADVRIPPRVVQTVDPIATTGTQWVTYTNVDGNAAPKLLVAGDVVTVSGENSAQIETVTVLAVASVPFAGSNCAGNTPPAGTSTWKPSATFGPTQYVIPTVANGLWYRGSFTGSTTSGTTGTTEPTWPLAIGRTVVDGSMTWAAVGASTYFQANFTKAHDVGATVTTGNFPYWWSTQRHALIVVTAAASLDPNLRRKVNEFMARVARGVSTWSIVQPSSTTAIGGTIATLQVGSPMGVAAVSFIGYSNSM